MVKHPAPFSDSVLKCMKPVVASAPLVLDPFAGTGRIHSIHRNAIGVEIEPEWANMHPRTIVGDALHLPFSAQTFDAIATSPCYGNRFADHHNARDGSHRRSYTHDLGRKLHRNNAGTLHWGEDYCTFHRRAWSEAVRVLKVGGLFVLNISDHVRRRSIVPVSSWHFAELTGLGLYPVNAYGIATPRMRYGENGDARVNGEIVFVLRKVTA